MECAIANNAGSRMPVIISIIKPRRRAEAIDGRVDRTEAISDVLVRCVASALPSILATVQ
jgi:hypothetical protein